MKRKIKKYQKMIIEYLNEYVQVKPANLGECECIVLADTQSNHFQAITMG